MALKLFNFLTRKKEIFKPLVSGRAGFYACGPTVYDYVHIGNLRTYIFEDVLRHALEYDGYRVKHIVNITDVEDKIIRGAQKAGKPISEFVRPYEKAFFDDLKELNIERAFEYPKATENIKEMIGLIAALLKKGLAYKSDGSVYFDISEFKKYGRLSELKSRELKSGARVNADEYDKTNAEDFVLWKAAKAGEPFWNSPFGKGRPGWHIECSAMSMKYLNATFDIHGGAVDLIFPHHENEIAQSEGATGKPFAKYFVEGEHLLINGEKMSKSLGNVYNLRDLEAKNFNPLAFRYLVLTAHYRSKLNFTWESLRAAQNALENLTEIVKEIKNSAKGARPAGAAGRAEAKKFKKEFLAAINDDLETPAALAILWKAAKSEKLSGREKLELIFNFDKVLGLELDKIKPEKIPAAVLKMANEREKYRQEKNFAKADELREKIESLGWLTEDSPSGPKLKKK